MTVAERSVTAIEELPVSISADPKSAATVEQPAPPPSMHPPALDGDVPTEPTVASTEANSSPSYPDVSGYDTKHLLINAANTSVDALILRAYQKLEKGLLRASPGPITPGQPATVSLRQLLAAGMIPESIAESVAALRSIRNDVAHGRARVSMIDAMTFDNAVQTVLNALKLAKGETVSDISAGFIGQSDLATMNYDELRSRLARDAQ